MKLCYSCLVEEKRKGKEVSLNQKIPQCPICGRVSPEELAFHINRNHPEIKELADIISRSDKPKTTIKPEKSILDKIGELSLVEKIGLAFIVFFVLLIGLANPLAFFLFALAIFIVSWLLKQG